MSEIIELVYASRAAFAPAGGGGIEPEVARILAQSRRNNPRQNIGGVLCYKDGYFFQCLEGEPHDVEAVYQRIARDPRHQEIRLLSRRTVTRRRFTSWAMKYAAVADDTHRLLQKHGLDRFNPYVFGNDMTRALVSLLHAATDPNADPEPRPSPGKPHDVQPAPRRLAGGALAMAVAAMAVALVALYRTLGE